MYVIGERINGMFVDVKDAIVSQDASVIQDLAKRQLAAGATALDVNAGPAAAEQPGDRGEQPYSRCPHDALKMNG